MIHKENPPQNSSIDETHLLNQALADHKAGRLKSAFSKYRDIISINPNNPDAHHLLGVIYLAQNKLDQAISYILRAIQLYPKHATYYNNLGNAYFNKKQLEDAILAYQKAVQLNPEYKDAHQNIGILYHSKKNFSQALIHYSKALKLNPNDCNLLLSMGDLYKDLKELTYAIQYYQNALLIDPSCYEAYNNLGIIYNELGQLDKAEKYFEKALFLNDQLAEIYNNIGCLKKDQFAISSAISYFTKAIQLDQIYYEAYLNLANCYVDINDYEHALETYSQAIGIEPQTYKAYHYLGITYIHLKKWELAVAKLREALVLDPKNGEIYNSLGVALKEQKKNEQAVDAFKKAIEITPNLGKAYNNLIHLWQNMGEWDGLEKIMPQFDRLSCKALENGSMVFEDPFLSLTRHLDYKSHFATARAKSIEIKNTVAHYGTHFLFKKKGKKKITIGYVSNNFRNHPMAHLIIGLLYRHNREEFNIFCYSFSDPDNSGYYEKITQHCDQMVDIRELPTLLAAQRIFDDQVDILVDLLGHTSGNRMDIFALRPAPIQVRYLGMFGTTGADFIDYLISDKIITPEQQASYYSESFAYMPHTYQVNDDQHPVAPENFSKEDWGLLKDHFIFACFSTAYKIEPGMFQVWMNILKKAPKSILWLMKENPDFEKNIRKAAQSHGIAGHRFVFAEKIAKPVHLARIKLVDLALDTRIVNGAATTSDMLWVDVPVLTLKGKTFASCMSESILRAIGLPELVAPNMATYENQAVDFALNPERLRPIKEKLKHNRTTHPLFNNRLFAKNIELLYKEMFERWIKGEKPQQIDSN